MVVLKSFYLLCSVVFIISACASPFLGFMVDKVGKNVFWGEYIKYALRVYLFNSHFNG